MADNAQWTTASELYYIRNIDKFCVNRRKSSQEKQDEYRKELLVKYIGSVDGRVRWCGIDPKSCMETARKELSAMK